MAKVPEQSDAPDHSQFILRNALIRISKFISAEKICSIAVDYYNSLNPNSAINRTDIMEGHSLRLFIKGKTESMGKRNYDFFEPLILRSPLGRAMRLLDHKSVNELDKLIDAIMSGEIYRPADVNYAGAYFMYYGSYVEPSVFGVRVVEISRGPAYSFEVKDSIRDVLNDQGRVRTSYGALTFFKTYPQILLRPKEYNEKKIGMTFMIGNYPIVDEENHVERLTGTFLTLTSTGVHACRHWMMVHEPAIKAEAMIKQSGTYSPEQIRAMPKHQEAFTILHKSLQVSELDKDQMFAYKAAL